MRGGNMCKKIIGVLMLTIMLFGMFLSADDAWAAGVSVFQYEYPVGSFTGTMNVREGDYNWSSGRYYYKVIYTFPQFGQGGLFYSGTLEISSSSYESSEYESCLYYKFQGLTSAGAWVDVGSSYYRQYSSGVVVERYYITDWYKQLRLVIYIREDSSPGSYRAGSSASLSVKYIKASVYSIGADQGTVNNILTETINTKNAANNAATAANNAKTSADAAKAEAINAKNAANTAASRVWDSTESKSAATLAKEARDKANAALTEITNVKNTINNIQASVGPMIQKVATANAATCTQGTSIPVIVQASGATEFRARADTGSWTAWTPVGSSVTVTGITGTGPHVIYVEARNSAGTTATGQLTVFKL